jgi:plasmid stabilization system protein ParE
VSLPIRFTTEADAQVEEIDRWWHANREDSPDLFQQELSQGLALISQTPRLGVRYQEYPARNVRRVLLRVTGYHLYYLTRTDVVWVVAVWHARRGSEPPLLI